MLPLTLSLSPSGGEGIETTPSPSARERVGVRVAHVFTHSPGYPRRSVGFLSSSRSCARTAIPLFTSGWAGTM
jgi:hypothetical protein